MRFIRLLFVVILAIILISIALANRQMVTLSMFPANFGQYLGGDWSIDLPLFLVIFLAMVFGLVVGFIWEWMRESQIRREARLRANQVAQLEREVNNLRDTHAAPRDEVLAILDNSNTAGRNTGARPVGAGASVPAISGR